MPSRDGTGHTRQRREHRQGFQPSAGVGGRREQQMVDTEGRLETEVFRLTKIGTHFLKRGRLGSERVAGNSQSVSHPPRSSLNCLAALKHAAPCRLGIYSLIPVTSRPRAWLAMYQMIRPVWKASKPRRVWRRRTAPAPRPTRRTKRDNPRLGETRRDETAAQLLSRAEAAEMPGVPERTFRRRHAPARAALFHGPTTTQAVNS